MELSNKLWDKSKYDQELYDHFQKIIKVNRVHNRSVSFEDFPESHPDSNEDFCNFVSVIIDPQRDSAVSKFLASLYERMDLTLLISYFYNQQSEDFDGLTVESVGKLRKLFEEVLSAEARSQAD